MNYDYKESESKNVSMSELMEMDLDKKNIIECEGIRELARNIDNINIDELDYPEFFDYLKGLGFKSTEQIRLLFKTLLQNFQPFELSKRVSVDGEECFEFLVARAFTISLKIHKGTLYLSKAKKSCPIPHRDFLTLIPYAFITGIDEQYDLMEFHINCGVDVYPVKVKGRPFKNYYIVEYKDIQNSLNEIKDNVLDLFDIPEYYDDLIPILTEKIKNTNNVTSKKYFDMAIERSLIRGYFEPFTLERIRNNMPENNKPFFEKCMMPRLDLFMDNMEYNL